MKTLGQNEGHFQWCLPPHRSDHLYQSSWTLHVLDPSWSQLMACCRIWIGEPVVWWCVGWMCSSSLKACGALSQWQPGPSSQCIFLWLEVVWAPPAFNLIHLQRGPSSLASRCRSLLVPLGDCSLKHRRTLETPVDMSTCNLSTYLHAPLGS